MENEIEIPLLFKQRLNESVFKCSKRYKEIMNNDDEEESEEDSSSLASAAADKEKYRGYFKLFLENKLLDKYAVDYSDWLKVGLILYNEFGEWEMFDEFSKLCRHKYDRSNNIDKWNSFFDNTSDNPLLFPSLLHMVKKDNPKIYDNIVQTGNTYIT